MKKLIAATFAIAAAAPFAANADTFSGAYAGVGLDLNALSSQITVNDDRNGNVAGAANGSSSSNSGGTLWGGAVYGGWGKCFNQFYVGAELGLDLQGGQVEDSIQPVGIAGSSRDSVKLTRGLSVSPTARLGYLIAPKTLAFIKLGVAGTSFKQSVSSNSGVAVNYKKTHTLWGFTMGAGMETCISSKMKLRAEYIRTVYPTASATSGVSLTAAAGPYASKIKPIDNIFRVGVAYSF